MPIIKCTIDRRSIDKWTKHQRELGKKIILLDPSGLRLAINARSSSWNFNYRKRGLDYNGKRHPQRTIRIGDSINMSPQQAKLRVEELKADVRDGGDPASEVLEIRAIGDRNKIHTERFALHAFDDAIDFIVRKNQCHNIYVVVNPVPQDAPKAAKDVDINRALFVFADADELGAADRARSCDLFPKSMEVVTGVVPHFRNHIYYRLSVPLTDMAVWSELQKQWASYLGTDKSIHNPSRIMRVAGTVSYPSPSKIKRGYQVELTRLIIGGVYVE